MKRIIILLLLIETIFANSIIDDINSSCHRGNADACIGLAKVFEKDKKLFKYFLDKACDNNGTICLWIAGDYKNGSKYYKKDLKQSINYYKKACEADIVTACSHLAWVYKGFEEFAYKDRNLSNYYYQKSANLGDDYAQYYIAKLYQYGNEGFKQDIQKAIELYRKSADQNNTDAIYSLAFLYKMGEGVKRDEKEFKRLIKLQNKLVRDRELQKLLKDKSINLSLKKAQFKIFEFSLDKLCRGGMNEACHVLSNFYSKNTIYKDTLKSIEYAKKSCDRGYPPSCGLLKYKIYPKDSELEDKMAKKLYERGCNSGNAFACSALGIITQDREKKYLLLKRGCQGGSGLGCYEIADIESLRDKELSKQYYKKACELGMKYSCYKLISIKDIKIAKDRSKKIDRLKRLCEKDGINDACLTLSNIYKYGIGVAKDIERAKIYLKKFRKRRNYIYLPSYVVEIEGEDLNDLKMAFELYENDCKNGDEVVGCIALAKMAEKYPSFAKGRYSKDDLVEFYAKSCKKGVADACFRYKKLNNISYKDIFRDIIKKMKALKE